MVRERERISLPPTDGLLAAIKRGAKTFAEAGGAYFGDPTAASAEEGENLLSVMEHLGSKAKKRQGCARITRHRMPPYDTPE
jgi:creatinine amidohydrolase/Fe(II)-dependent formamide hydrolase-like protein